MSLKLSERTIAVLKNFASINNSILIKTGSELSTVSPQKSVLAKMKIEESFPRKIAIYDLGQFLSVLSLFKEPELEFHETYMTISCEQEKVRYGYADESLIVTPPTKELNFPEPEVVFNFSAETLAKIQKAGAALGLPEVAVVGEEELITVRAIDSKQPDANSYRHTVGETDLEFRAVFKTENLKLLSDEYTVSVSSKGIARFASKAGTYFIATEASSKF